MHVFARRTAQTARVVRPRLARSLNSAASLEALKVVHYALKDGHDGERALQYSLNGTPAVDATPSVTVILPTGDTQDVPIDVEDALDAEEDGAEYEHFVEEKESILDSVHFGPYPPLAAHAVLHGHIKANRIVQASALYFIQLGHGTKFKARSLEALVDALCPPPGTLPGLPFSPTIRIHPGDSVHIFGDAVERMTRDVDTGTAVAQVLVNAAREEASPRNTATYRRIVDALLLQKKLATAANVYAQLVRDWHLRVWLSNTSPHDEPLDDPVAAPALAESRDDVLDASTPDHSPTVNDTAVAREVDAFGSDAAATVVDASAPEHSGTVEESVVAAKADASGPDTAPAAAESSTPDEEVTTEVDAMLLDLYKREDIAAAHQMRLSDPSFILPIGNKLLGRIVRAILFPEAVDMRKPDRRFTTAPRWDKDALIATFILVELLERRQMGARDITGVLKAAAAAPPTPNFPIKLFRGGKLHRVKPHAHIESVLRALMREPPLGALRPRAHAHAPPDMLRPLTVEAYNELLLFGLSRQVSPFELHALVDSMCVVGVEPNQETDEVLFRRTKLSQNKLVDELLARMPRTRKAEPYLEQRGVREKRKTAR